MKKQILSRYVINADNRVVLDISVEKIEDLYHYFDRTAPYLKKDLDPELAEYLIECVREIGRSDFLIRISLPLMPDAAGFEKVRGSVRNYFEYMAETERRTLREMFRKTAIMFGVGLMVLALSIEANRSLAPSGGVIGTVLAEGLTIAAWVSLWEGLATLLIQWPPSKKDISIYSRIARAPVEFKYFTQE